MIGFRQKVLHGLMALALCAAAQTSSAMLVAGTAGYEPSSATLAPIDFTLLPTKWGPGGTTQDMLVPFLGTPGGATWSIMGAGHVDVSGFDPGHVGATTAITSLGFSLATIEGWIDWALDTWAAVANFTNLGMVADGGGHAGALGAAGGTGHIRVAAWEIGTAGVLAHAFQPGNEAYFGAGGSIAGDVHFDARTWIDDPLGTDPDNGLTEFDLPTVLLHEIGHALGLGHSAVVGSVMEPIYATTRRTLTADDIAGIQAIYGVRQTTPEPGMLVLLMSAFGVVVFLRRQKRAA